MLFEEVLPLIEKASSVLRISVENPRVRVWLKRLQTTYVQLLPIKHPKIGPHFGREYEKLSRKLADYRSHLRFNLRFRESRLVLRSLGLGLTVKGHRAGHILLKSQNPLLSGRIRQVHLTIDALKDRVH